MEEIEKKISELYKKCFHIENPDLTVHFTDLGGKSVEVMKLQVEIKKTFGIKIDFRNLYKLGSIEKITQFILQQDM